MVARSTMYIVSFNLYKMLEHCKQVYEICNTPSKTSINGACDQYICHISSLEWHHNVRDGVSNHQRFYCLLKRLFRRWSKKTSKPLVTGLCDGCIPPKRVSNAERCIHLIMMTSSNGNIFRVTGQLWRQCNDLFSMPWYKLIRFTNGNKAYNCDV